MNNKKKYIAEWLKDSTDAIKSGVSIPDLTSLIIIVIFLFFELFSYDFAGASVTFEFKLMMLIVTLIPFVMGIKISKNHINKADYVLSALLLLSIVFLGLEVKNPEISNLVINPGYYIVYLILVICWYFLDFKNIYENYSRLRLNTAVIPEKEYDEDGNEIG